RRREGTSCVHQAPAGATTLGAAGPRGERGRQAALPGTLMRTGISIINSKGVSVISHSPPRRAAALLTALALGVSTLLVSTAAVAAEGPAPAPQELRVIAAVRTDAVSTLPDAYEPV